MTHENAQYIPELVPTNPAGTAPVSQGDDHFRSFKASVQNSFPGLPSGPVINAPEITPPDEALAGNANLMLWTPKALADFIKEYWGGWGLSTTTTNSYLRAHNDGSGGSQLFNPAGPYRLPLNTHGQNGGGVYDENNARWTPGVGIYRVTGQWNADPDSRDSNGTLRLEIRVNGNRVAGNSVYYGFDGQSLGLNVSDDCVVLNLATDYIELWTNHQVNINGFLTDSDQTFISASRVGDIIP